MKLCSIDAVAVKLYPEGAEVTWCVKPTAHMADSLSWNINLWRTEEEWVRCHPSGIRVQVGNGHTLSYMSWTPTPHLNKRRESEYTEGQSKQESLTRIQSQLTHLRDTRTTLLDMEINAGGSFESVQRALLYTQEIDWCISDLDGRIHDLEHRLEEIQTPEITEYERLDQKNSYEEDEDTLVEGYANNPLFEEDDFDDLGELGSLERINTHRQRVSATERLPNRPYQNTAHIRRRIKPGQNQAKLAQTKRSLQSKTQNSCASLTLHFKSHQNPFEPIYLTAFTPHISWKLSYQLILEENQGSLSLDASISLSELGPWRGVSLEVCTAPYLPHQSLDSSTHNLTPNEVFEGRYGRWPSVWMMSPPTATTYAEPEHKPVSPEEKIDRESGTARHPASTKKGNLSLLPELQPLIVTQAESSLVSTPNQLEISSQSTRPSIKDYFSFNATGHHDLMPTSSSTPPLRVSLLQTPLKELSQILHFILPSGHKNARRYLALNSPFDLKVPAAPIEVRYKGSRVTGQHLKFSDKVAGTKNSENSSTHTLIDTGIEKRIHIKWSSTVEEGPRTLSPEEEALERLELESSSIQLGTYVHKSVTLSSMLLEDISLWIDKPTTPTLTDSYLPESITGFPYGNFVLRQVFDHERPNDILSSQSVLGPKERWSVQLSMGKAVTLTFAYEFITDSVDQTPVSHLDADTENAIREASL